MSYALSPASGERGGVRGQVRDFYVLRTETSTGSAAVPCGLSARAPNQTSRLIYIRGKTNAVSYALSPASGERGGVRGQVRDFYVLRTETSTGSAAVPCGLSARAPNQTSRLIYIRGKTNAVSYALSPASGRGVG